MCSLILDNSLKVSVIIVSYKSRADLISLIEALQKQTCQNFEIIVVDNGGNETVWRRLHTFELLHIQCPTNFILSEGRNIGVHFARGQYISFLDDDALVPEDYICSIMEGFEKFPKIVGFRGKVLEKRSHKNNLFAGHYDLGNKPIIHYCNTEGNSAFRKKAYVAEGGMNPLLFGEEGTELSARLSKTHGIKSMIYWPKTIIFHDYAITDNKMEIKEIRHERMRRYINEYLKHVAKYRKRIGNYKKREKLFSILAKLIKRIKLKIDEYPAQHNR